MTDGQNTGASNPESELNRAAGELKTREKVNTEQVKRWQQTVTTELHPVQNIGGPAILFLCLFGIWAVIVVLSPLFLASLGWRSMDAAQKLQVWLAIVFAASLTTALLTRAMIPGTRAIFRPSAAVMILLTGLLVVLTAAFVANGNADLAGQGVRCLRTGIPLAVLTALLICSYLRRGVVQRTSGNAAAVGFLSGLCSLAVLELHCPNMDRWHILLTHFSIPALLAALGALWPDKMLFWLRQRAR